MSHAALRILAIHTSPEDLRPHPAWLTELVARQILQIDNAPDFHAAAAALVLARPRYEVLLVDAEILARRHVEMLHRIQRHVSLPLWFFPATRGFGPSPEALPPGALPAYQAALALQHSRLDASTQRPDESRKENRAAPVSPQTPPQDPPQKTSPRLQLPALLRPLPRPAAEVESIVPAAPRPHSWDQALPTPPSENVAEIPVEKHMEILVAQAVAPGYDAQNKRPSEPQVPPGPLLSDSELQALLGSAE